MFIIFTKAYLCEAFSDSPVWSRLAIIFYLDRRHGGTSGPELILGGTAVVDGQLGGWTPIGAEETAGGYEVAFTLPGTNLFTIWNEDSNGNYVSDTIGAVSGTNTALETAETTSITTSMATDRSAFRR